MKIGSSIRFVSVFAPAVIMCCTASSAAAEPLDAATARASFEEGRATGVTPQTPGEYLSCAAMWDRWEYFMLSANTPDLKRGIGKALSAPAARKQAAKLRQKARALAKRWDDVDDLPALTAEGEAYADAQYAAFITSQPDAAHDFLMSLGICK
ncbi:hypothetical protein [Porphyrobacter sp. AAP60]|uniref:hypothetical protein n=1 Tax=Porphyrobacter sp. AAP60 TaxID=1523423 RepID=UPI0006CD2C47|nr:hypothetical protein [Porphyrobacter sp. AAP60]KPF63084.1 hypothetical protein IP79_11050 [Porphyrobacter sp. AAP60]